MASEFSFKKITKLLKKITGQASPADKFFEDTDLTLRAAKKIVQEGLKGADYGEFYQEITENELLEKDKGVYTTVSIGNRESGFGFRVGQQERVGYAVSDIFNEAALRAAVKQAREVLKENSENPPKPFGRISEQLYPSQNPMESMTLEQKIAKMDEIETYVRTLSPRISNVTLRYKSESKAVHIITADGQSLIDNRPVASLVINVMVTDENGKSESGYSIMGGRVDCKDAFDKTAYQEGAKKALKLADTLLIADEAPAGKMDVVLANGWNAIILHEAIGHGLEADFNRKKISVYSEDENGSLIGKPIAAPKVTVIDQGDMPGERGSLHFDDEGTPTKQNILIENGTLKGYMQDRQNALLMDAELTGNGRRETYRHVPMPRMTNTYFAAGNDNPEDIIKSVKDGLYVTDIGNGQVDITSGKFNMNATLAWRIRDGKVCEPVKGATLVGDGLTVIKTISMVGNDLTLEKSSGVCGKDGQSVIVGCGQPTIKVSNMLVGGMKK